MHLVEWLESIFLSGIVFHCTVFIFCMTQSTILNSYTHLYPLKSHLMDPSPAHNRNESQELRAFQRAAWERYLPNWWKPQIWHNFVTCSEKEHFPHQVLLAAINRLQLHPPPSFLLSLMFWNLSRTSGLLELSRIAEHWNHYIRTNVTSRVLSFLMFLNETSFQIHYF